MSTGKPGIVGMTESSVRRGVKPEQFMGDENNAVMQMTSRCGRMHGMMADMHWQINRALVHPCSVDYLRYLLLYEITITNPHATR